jgi:hypothetical protein
LSAPSTIPRDSRTTPATIASKIAFASGRGAAIHARSSGRWSQSRRRPPTVAMIDM